MKNGFFLNIQRFSIHDGPGIRTLVFMKGCPLRCSWCSNPESQKAGAELGFIKGKCVKCLKCVEACQSSAIKVLESSEIFTDRKLCKCCGKCVEVCSYEAREIAGKDSSIEELLTEVEKDREFYANSGGGVTVGGGEPTQQHDFVREFLKQCQERWLHTAIETSGYAPWEHLKEILNYVDFIFFDIKHMDPVVHKQITGLSNQLILENLEKIVAHMVNPQVVVRVPIIPGLNDSEQNISATAEFVNKLGSIKGIELLPYHRLGNSKYEQFGMEYQLENTRAPSAEHMKKLQTIIESYGLGLYD